MRGSRSNAAATLGIGPMQINVTGSGDPMMTSIIAPTPSL